MVSEFQIRVTVVGKNFALSFPYDQILVEKVKSMPQRRFDPKGKRWLFKPTVANIQYVKKWFPQAVWDEDTFDSVGDALGRLEKRADTAKQKLLGDFDFSLLDNVPFKLPPMDHQKVALLLGRDTTSFAYLMDQGTGKTKVSLDDASHNFRMGRIDALLVLAPNSVKTNWVDPDEDPDEMDEVLKHIAPDIIVNKGCWVSSPTRDQKAIYRLFYNGWGDPIRLHILAVNIESLHVDRVYAHLLEFVTQHKVMIVCDECTRIKNRASKRTKKAIKLREFCLLARIMSGTPLIKSPLDAFAQFKFLDEDILGYSSFYAFRNHFAVMGGFQGYQVLYYKNLEELSEKINSCSYRITKSECLKLPPQVYLKRKVEMSPVQKKAYRQMKDDMIVRFEGIDVRAPIVLTQLLRLQQITGGYLPRINGNGDQSGVIELVSPKSNPKFQALMEIIEESGDQKIVMWCRFKAEIYGLRELLKDQMKLVEFHGDIKESDRVKNRRAFFNDPSIKGMIANQQTGGVGIDELKSASISCYVSNSFDTEQRIQSEDRMHRIGSEVHDQITYWDLYCPGTVDTKLITTMRANKKVSDEVMKDGWRQWI